MVNLAQVIKGLRAARSRARKEVNRLEKAMAALGKLDGKPGRHARRSRMGKRRELTATARKKIAAAQRAWWAKVRQEKSQQGLSWRRRRGDTPGCHSFHNHVAGNRRSHVATRGRLLEGACAQASYLRVGYSPELAKIAVGLDHRIDAYHKPIGARSRCPRTPFCVVRCKLLMCLGR